MPDVASPISWPRRIGRVLAIVLVLALAALALRAFRQSGLLDTALRWIQSLGPWAPLVFILLYVATVIICLPAAILTAGGGFLFGMFKGSLLVLLAATIAGNLCFLAGRHVARDWVGRKLSHQPRFKALDDATARDGWKIIVLVRLAPVFPFSLTSYAFGLTRIPFGHYFLANFAMIPGTLMYVYFGSVARDIAEKPLTPSWMKWIVFAVTLVVVLYLTRFAKRVLSQKIS